MLRTTRYAALPLLLLIGACTTVPAGPSVLALPGSGKTFDEFRADDYECRQFAYAQIGGPNAANAATESGVTSAAVGTLLGAAAGAAINGSRGAGVGAGTGLALGGLVGTGTAQASAYTSQQRYDIAYQQCMYAKGERVPVSGQFSSSSPVMREPRRAYRAPRPGVPPPPPPGMPPPPPPGVLQPS